MFSKVQTSNRSTILSFNIPGIKYWKVVDKKKYKKKAIKNQFELLNLNLSPFFLTTNNEIIINKSVFKLTAKFPTMKQIGKI